MAVPVLPGKLVTHSHVLSQRVKAVLGQQRGTKEIHLGKEKDARHWPTEALPMKISLSS